MADVEITVFNGIEVKEKPKVALSKTFDKTFIFANVKTKTLAEAFLIMTKEFTLSVPLNLCEPTRMQRDSKSLSVYKYPKLKNMVLDLDEIKTASDYEGCIDYFKEKGYSCVLGKSRSWNGKSIFNMKGIMRVSIENNPEIIEAVLTQLQVELGSKCKVDLSIKSDTSYQAPSHSKMMVYNNEFGKKLTSSDIYVKDVQELLSSTEVKDSIEITYNNEIMDECIKVFSELGYTPVRNSMQQDGAINFQHPVEKKSVGSFFWFSSQPMVMNHPNKSRSISIFSIIKDTIPGKKWLKNKTKEEQRHQLIKDNSSKYIEYRGYNERYLDFTDTSKIDVIDSFINNEDNGDNEVLKIKSAMGTAKSAGIELCINKAHEKGLKVILISNRVSVARDFTQKYGMMWYKDPEAYKQNQSLVVQFDSLHRFDIDKFDVVILDEFISLLFHHKGNLTGNTNINIVKFKIFMEKKKVLVADAFLTGFEDIFFPGRKIRMIDNDYRDDIKLFEYTNKNNFSSKIITTALQLKGTDKKISCSFTSNNIMKAVNYELKERGVKVVMLNAETPEHTRSIIYSRFEELHHSAYDVILYSPTLTVGVSNLNDIDVHFHYDSGMSADVISSLQMIKRSRTAKEIHYFLEERQFYYDTNVKSINSAAETNINNFYNNKDSTLLIDIDYSTGKLKLTPLAKYVNKIEAFYNITKNNHANAFKVLLEHQVQNTAEIINDEVSVFNLKETIKNIKEREKQDKISVLEAWEDKDFSGMDIEMLKTKTIELTQDEKMGLLLQGVKDRFKDELTQDELHYIAQQEIETDFKYLGYISKLRSANKAFNSIDYTKYLLSQAISSDVTSLQNKTWINFLEYLSLLSSVTKLKKSYSENDIRVMDAHFQVGTKFKRFIKSIGYVRRKGDARYRLDDKIQEFSTKM